ncbi:hypothetical protein D3C78_1363250 [compost metagenome]
MLVELATGDGQRLVQHVLARVIHDAHLLTHIQILCLLELLVGHALFRQGDQRFVTGLRRIHGPFHLLHALLIGMHGLLIADQQQPQGHGADPQEILAHLVQRENGGHPDFVDFAGLLVHAIHLHQRETTDNQNQQGKYRET